MFKDVPMKIVVPIIVVTWILSMISSIAIVSVAPSLLGIKAGIDEGAVTADKIAAGAVITAKLADGTVTSAKILDGTITATDLSDGSIIAVKIADGAVTTIKIASEAITSDKIADKAVTISKIADEAWSAIVSTKLENNSVTSAKILDGAIIEVDISNGAVTAAKIADGAVTTSKIADNAIVTIKLADNSVTTAKIVDATITAADLATGAVTTTKIADGAVTRAKLAAGISKYWISGSLNTVSRDVTTTWTKLDNFLTFTKELGTSVIEVLLASRATGGTFSGAFGVLFEVRINDQATTMANRGAITTTGTIDFITINAVYTNLPAGTYTVSVWAQAAPSGSSSGVLLDPGGWSGRIIVTESF